MSLGKGALQSTFTRTVESAGGHVKPKVVENSSTHHAGKSVKWKIGFSLTLVKMEVYSGTFSLKLCT